MRAIEIKTLFAGVNYDAERNYKLHKQRLKNMKKSIDNDVPTSYEIRNRSPNKRVLGNKQAIKERIYRDNFFLAKRIFDIMEGESQLSEMINDTRHLENHPGTMNFKARLEEAQRIHYENMLLASRLNSVEPHYKNDELSVVRSVQEKPRFSPRSKKTRFLRELEYTLRMASPIGTYRSPHGYEDAGWSPNNQPAADGLAPEDGEDGHEEGDPMGENNVLRDQDLKVAAGRPRSVILEYTKVQNSRVLDIAVVKEPYRDRYVIYGKDIEDGQRFELQLTSEDVSNILDGDILVTSVDNVEVWMALLHKVELEEVEQFSKIATMPPPPEAEYSLSQAHAPPPAHARPPQQRMMPSAPEAFLRPSEGVSGGAPIGGGKGFKRGGKGGHNAHRVIREKGQRPGVGGGEVDEPVMSEVDKPLLKVEEAAKKRLKNINNANNKKNAPQVPAIPLNKAKEVAAEAITTEREDNTPATSSRTVPETENTANTLIGTPSKNSSTPSKDKDNSKSGSRSNSPRQTNAIYTTPTQPTQTIRKSFVKQTTTATTTPTATSETSNNNNNNATNSSPTATNPTNSNTAQTGNDTSNANTANTANTVNNANNANVKPKPPPAKPSASYPAAQSNPNTVSSKRPTNIKTTRASSDATTQKDIPKAAAKAVATVEGKNSPRGGPTTVSPKNTNKGSTNPISPKKKKEEEAIDRQLQQTVQSVVTNAIQSALANMSPLASPVTTNSTGGGAAVGVPSMKSSSLAEGEKQREKEVPPAPANTVDLHETNLSLDMTMGSGKLKVNLNLFPSVELDKNTPASPLNAKANASTAGVANSLAAIASTSLDKEQLEAETETGVKSASVKVNKSTKSEPAAVASASFDAKYDLAEELSLSTSVVNEDSYSKEAFDPVESRKSTANRPAKSRGKSRGSVDALDDSYNDDFENST